MFSLTSVSVLVIHFLILSCITFFFLACLKKKVLLEASAVYTIVLGIQLGLLSFLFERYILFEPSAQTISPSLGYIETFLYAIAAFVVGVTGILMASLDVERTHEYLRHGTYILVSTTTSFVVGAMLFEQVLYEYMLAVIYVSYALSLVLLLLGAALSISISPKCLTHEST